MTTFQRGIEAEHFVASLLVSRGLRLLAKRYKTPLGEIDLIMEGRSLLVVIEVKYRKKESCEDLVSLTQKRRLIRAFSCFLHTYPIYASYDAQFDIAYVGGKSSHFHVNYVENAFDLSVIQEY